MLYLRPIAANLEAGITRREWLKVGLGGALTLPALASRARAGGTQATPGFGKAKGLIMIDLFGGPSHIDIWDMKPDAPEQIRGEFRPIPTSVPGLEITEHLPRLAARAHQYAIIRSMSHGDSAHGSASHWMMTGRRPRALGEVGPTPEDFPSYGSVISHLRPASGAMPPFVALPLIISTSTNLVPGQDGGFLGQGMDPFRISAPASTYDFALPELQPDAAVTPHRLASRRRLRESLDTVKNVDIDTLYGRAFDLMAAPEVAKAFQLDLESPLARDRYGRNAFGQSLLLARRLIEAGVSAVTVYWPERTEVEAFNNNGVIDKVPVAAWDTHGNHVGATANFPMLRDKNLPPLDLASAALLDDLTERGLLDQTLVVWTGEFGRSPRVNGDAGRDHYGNVFSLMMAGGGVRGGYVHGSSDRFGAYPDRDPVNPAQFAASLYHALGFDPHAEIRDNLNRPFRLAEADPIASLFA